ncbi:MAG: molybdopterin dinucleotide binding domain-containing protein [Candidatus Helarchaeota archaeon]
MDFFKTLVPQMEFMVVIGRTINQEKTARYGKLSNEYFENSAICLMHPNDVKKLGMKEGKVKITTKVGSVVVRAESDEFETSEGVIVIPFGPWANKLIDESEFKEDHLWFKASVETTNEEIMSIEAILKELRGD